MGCVTTASTFPATILPARSLWGTCSDPRQGSDPHESKCLCLWLNGLIVSYLEHRAAIALSDQTPGIAEEKPLPRPISRLSLSFITQDLGALIGKSSSKRIETSLHSTCRLCDDRRQAGRGVSWRPDSWYDLIDEQIRLVMARHCPVQIFAPRSVRSARALDNSARACRPPHHDITDGCDLCAMLSVVEHRKIAFTAS